MKLKHPMGRVVDVAADLAPGYIELGWEAVEGEPAGEPGTPSKSWKVDALKVYAEEHGINLGEATKKDDILAAIEAAEAEGEPAGEPENAE